MRIKKIYYLVFVSIIFIACGPTPKAPPPPIVNVSQQQEGLVQSSEKIKRAIDTIKDELGSSFEKVYLSKDQNDAYVVKKSASYDRLLLDYDITVMPPVQRKIVDSVYNTMIAEVFPLSNKKLIYLLPKKMEKLEVVFYDLAADEKTTLWVFDSYYSTTGNSYLDPAEKYLTLGRTFIDLNNFMQPTSWHIQNPNFVELERKFHIELGESYISVLITKDGEKAFVVDKNPDHGENLSLYEIKGGEPIFKKRIVSVFEDYEIIKVLILNGSKIAYVSYDKVAPENAGYILYVYDYLKNLQLSHRYIPYMDWDNAFVAVDTKSIKFDNYDYYIEFAREYTEIYLHY